MAAIPSELKIDYKLFLNKTTNLFGESKTGKSFLILDILYHLAPHVEQIMVFSPNDQQNQIFAPKRVPLPMVHYVISPQILEALWERQQAFTAVAKRAQNPVVLKRLFDRCEDGRAVEAVTMFAAKYRARIEELRRSGADVKITETEEEYQRLIMTVYKKTISAHEKRVGKLKLSEDEQFTLKYLNFNPNLVVVFDDCTDQIKKFRTHPVINKFYTMCRWVSITMINGMHTDKALEPEQKKGAFTSIWTENSCANAYFERASNNFAKEERLSALATVKMVFSPLAKFQKLIWVRDEKRFYRYTAVNHPGDWRVGSDEFWNFCMQIKSNGASACPDNQFMQGFLA